MNIKSNLNKYQTDREDELVNRLKKVRNQLEEQEADKSAEIEAIDEKLQEIQAERQRNAEIESEAGEQSEIESDKEYENKAAKSPDIDESSSTE
jgi:Fic family protein